MQEDNLNKNGRQTFYLCDTFLTGKIIRQVKTLDRYWIKSVTIKKELQLLAVTP